MKIFFVFVLVSYSFIVKAQSHKIDTDRPDQTDGTHVVKTGEFQIESDVYYNTFAEENPAIISSSLLRLGLLPYSELRITVEEGIQRDVFIDETSQGVFPLAIGSKYELLKNHWWLPDLSIIGTVQLPFTSQSSERRMRWAPFVTMVYEKEFGKISLDVNTGVKGAAFKDSYSLQGSGSLRYDLAEKWIVFMEYFGQYSRDFVPQHNVDAGLIFFLQENLQVSASCGTTVLSDNYNRFVMVGFGYRLPK